MFGTNILDEEAVCWYERANASISRREKHSEARAALFAVGWMRSLCKFTLGNEQFLTIDPIRLGFLAIFY